MKMMYMSSYFKYEVILIKYPFTDLTVFKVRPAVIVNSDFISDDLFVAKLKARDIEKLENSLRFWLDLY